MDNITRLQYFDAMGIDVWVSRNKESFNEIHVGKEYNSDYQLDQDPWGVLQSKVSECTKCTLCETRTQTVLGTGNINADWMLVGEAPGYEEDLEGKPFLGQSGELLTEMIRAIGLDRESIYISNILKCKTPEGRDPRVEEIKACSDYLKKQINLVQPKIILAIGRIAAQTLSNNKEPLSKLRGSPHQLEGIPLVIMYHPAYLLRSLLEKKKVWQDLQLAMEQIK